MWRYLAWSLLMIFLSAACSVNAYSEELEIDGYKVEIYAKQSGNRGQVDLKVWGTIKGPPCKRLRCDVFLRNKNNNIANVVFIVKDIDEKFGVDFSTSDRIYIKKRESRMWTVTSMYFDCQQKK